MEEGTLTDGKGRTVNFKNNILVMTSNIGSKEILQVAKQSDDVDETELTANVVQGALEEAMRPELLNRIDEIVVFNPLSYDHMKDIASNIVANAVDRAADDLDIRLQVSDNIREIVTREALKSSSLYGARPVRRAVQRYVEDPMSEAIISGFVQEGDEVKLNLKNPNSDTRTVKITQLSANGGGGPKDMEIDVDADAGVTASQTIEEQAAFGDLPPMDDGDDDAQPPAREPDAFQ